MPIEHMMREMSGALHPAERVVILDRDGTVIAERHYLLHPEHVELLPGVGRALRALHRMGLRVIVLTNQSAVGRGWLTLRRLEEIHERLTALLNAEGVRLAGIYYCAHTPEDGCACRKPRPGLLERAAHEQGFDPRRSFVIGDKPCDVELGRRVGATTLLVQTGYGRQMTQSCQDHTDYVVEDLPAALPIIARLLEQRSIPVEQKRRSVKVA